MYVFSYVVCFICGLCFFFYKQKTAYDMRISDWSSDVCSSDLGNTLSGCLPAYPRGFLGNDYFLSQLCCRQSSGTSPETPAHNQDIAFIIALDRSIIHVPLRQVERKTCQDAGAH